MGDRSIKSKFKDINERRSMISILPEENLVYTAFLKVSTRHSVTDSIYNEIMNHVSNMRNLDSEKVTLLVILSYQENCF